MRKRSRSRRWLRERLLIIGRMRLTGQIVAELQDRPGGRTVIGIVDDSHGAGDAPGGCPVLGPLSRLPEIIAETRPDRVLVALGERRRRTPINALLECCVARGIVVEDAAVFYERITGKLAIESVTPTSILFSPRFGPSRLDRAMARLVSVALALVGLIACAPLMALIAAAIKLESAGPVLFVQARVGACGQPFNLMKFRTMRHEAAHRSEWEFDNRDRVTRIGRWLRAFRLDELPQFVNVLRGEMNLVGPRPHPVSNFELFTLVCRNLNEMTGSAIGYYALRTMVRPGITGWAQIRYRYANNIEEEIEKLRYDLFYVKHAGLLLDLRVLASTVRVILFGHRTNDTAASARESQPAKSLTLPPGVTSAHAA